MKHVSIDKQHTSDVEQTKQTKASGNELVYEEIYATEEVSMDIQHENKTNEEQTHARKMMETKEDAPKNVNLSSEKRKLGADDLSLHETDKFSTSDDIPIQEFIDKRAQLMKEKRKKEKETTKSDDDFSTSDEIPLKQIIEEKQIKKNREGIKERLYFK